ncbi:MAG: hypothetical protein JO101_00615 [Candidatus Eremiobacteraeota bacterium]|nr:hypothetical protein [Candidatus Eremiobacteraeota bacterium]
MKRLGILALLFVLCSSGVLAANRSQLAPADEYFGRLKMSILGIANTIRDAGVKLDNGANPTEVMDGPLAFATDAIEDWERHYPRDPWIPRNLTALQTAYEKIQTARGQELAHRTAAWRQHDFPQY